MTRTDAMFRTGTPAGVELEDMFRLPDEFDRAEARAEEARATQGVDPQDLEMASGPDANEPDAADDYQDAFSDPDPDLPEGELPFWVVPVTQEDRLAGLRNLLESAGNLAGLTFRVEPGEFRKSLAESGARDAFAGVSSDAITETLDSAVQASMILAAVAGTAVRELKRRIGVGAGGAR